MREVDRERDHVIGVETAEYTLVEYGSYACTYCHAAHSVVRKLRKRFGDRLTYVFRHLPLADRRLASSAAEMAEYASLTEDRFWDVHDRLMDRSPRFTEEDLTVLAKELGLPAVHDRDPATHKTARDRVLEDALSGIESGARVTPTFFINGRRYDGAWDESALAEALIDSPGHRLETVSKDFLRWAPAAGLLLLLSILAALVLSNSQWSDAFIAFWQRSVGVFYNDKALSLSLFDWVNHGLLTIFFLVVGLEIKHEFTVGRLASKRAAVLPVAAALGGMMVPTLIYLAVEGGGAFAHGWGLTIATDTAFAVALIVLLGDRVPVDLRVFLTAAVIVDDLVAIGLVAVVYTETIAWQFLGGAAVITALLMVLNRWNFYRPLPYILLGLLLWVCLHEAGVHATLAGVILALMVPTRPPPNVKVLMAQAQLILDHDAKQTGGAARSRELSPQALRYLDKIHDRMDSPSNKLLRKAEPWSSFFVLPIFALANSDLVWSTGLLDGHGRFAMAIILALVVGKPLGILGASWLAVRLKLASKPEAYTWGQLAGAGALAGIGFTMSLFIAGQAFPDAADFSAAKVAIFAASLVAGVLGFTILRWQRPNGS